MGIRSPAWLASFSLGFVKYEIFKTCCSGSVWISLPRLFQAPLLCQILNLISLFLFLLPYITTGGLVPRHCSGWPPSLYVRLFWADYLLVLCRKITEILSETPCTASISQAYLSVPNKDREDWTSVLSPVMICLFKQVKVASNNQPQTLPLRPSQVVRFCLPVQLLSEH